MALIDTALTGSRAPAFFAAFLPFLRQLATAGVHNSLIQSAIKLTAPGMPDLYNGSELWDLSLMDPDNRRPVDYTLRTHALEKVEVALQTDRLACMRELLRGWGDGRIKLATILTLLRHRQTQPALYTDGDYQSLSALGAGADEICAYARSRNEQLLIVAVARFSHRREQRPFEQDTQLTIPEPLRRARWHELLSGRTLLSASDSLAASVLFEELPVAVLVPDEMK